MATYRVTVNGFWCRSETWDDPLEFDGRHDEVFIVVNTRIIDKNGLALLPPLDSESVIMGDTWRYPNRTRAGTATGTGGIITGDRFPWNECWRRIGQPNTDRIPPYTIWEGELSADKPMVMLTPTIWEFDPGESIFNNWLDWQVSVDATYGKRAKEIFGGIWPVAKPVFDAVSLGIQTAGTLAGLWSPLGKQMSRPIGIQRDPANPDGYLFNPYTLALNHETVEYLIQNNIQGLGQGIVELKYTDDPYLRGEYSLYVQIERLTGDSDVQVQQGWLWCNKCQGLYFGSDSGVNANSRCPAGGIHSPQNESGSGFYSLPYNAPNDPNRQSDWRWCSKCQGLFFGPQFANSSCPAGGTHSSQAESGSGNYCLPHSVPLDPRRQSDWRWCNKCAGLFFGPNVANSVCPAGGTHTPPEESRSGNYSLPSRPFGDG